MLSQLMYKIGLIRWLYLDARVRAGVATTRQQAEWRRRKALYALSDL